MTMVASPLKNPGPTPSAAGRSPSPFFKIISAFDRRMSTLPEMTVSARAWQLGAGREPAPARTKYSGDLIQAWIDTGAEFP